MLPDLSTTPPPRLLDQVREMIRYKHYSLRTKEAYLYWVRFFTRWSARDGPMRHPRHMGADEVHAFWAMLTNERHVSASTHNKALSGLLFLYRWVLDSDLPWLKDIQWPTRPRPLPSVLSHAETAALLAAIGAKWNCLHGCSMARACASMKTCVCG